MRTETRQAEQVAALQEQMQQQRFGPGRYYGPSR